MKIHDHSAFDEAQLDNQQLIENSKKLIASAHELIVSLHIQLAQCKAILNSGSFAVPKRDRSE